MLSIGFYLLTDILVLVKPLLSDVAFLKFHTELEIKLHDWLVYLLPCPMLLTFDDIVQGVESSLFFTNLDELYTESMNDTLT